MQIAITSNAFDEGGLIPSKYTCDGVDVSPPLRWDGIPEGAASIALICDDPDAPMGTWVHWVLFNLPARAKELVENITTDETLTDGTRQGITISAKSVTAALARQAAHTDTSSRFTPSIRNSTWLPAPTNPSCSKQWKDTSSPRAS